MMTFPGAMATSLAHARCISLQIPRDLPAASVMAVCALQSLASFSSQARGIKFYSVPTESIRVGDLLDCRLEPTNPKDSNCIALWLSSPSLMLGHLVREAACYLAPLLRDGFVASG